MGILSGPPIGFAGAPTPVPDYPYIDPDELLLAVADLFARDTKLAEQIFDLGLTEHASGKRFPIFDYLFVDTGAPTLGAKYSVCGYRCRTPQEREVALRTLIGN
jgi:hypothetical protein